jgi:subtilisin family serine protease
MAIHRAAAFTAFLLSLMSAVPSFAGQDLPPQAASRAQDVRALRQRAERIGRVRVLVELRLATGAHVPEGGAATADAIFAQRLAIARASGRVLARLRGSAHRVVHQYQTIPYLALDVDAATLDLLSSSDTDVIRVVGDGLLRPILSGSAPMIEADQLWESGYDGTGTTVAVLDSGVDAYHPFLSGKVVEEACFSSTVAGTSNSVCPNGQDQQIGTGAAAPCGISGCEHGTHVAGIAAGAGTEFSGVAKGANIMAVQVFSEVIDAETCGGIAPCVGGFDSDVIAALERVYSVAAQRNVVAVNMSLGAGSFTSACDNEPYKPIIDNLRSIGVATVVASGNSGTRNSISSPACISSTISVGSVDRNDQISWFSNVASFLSLLAPGDGIVSSVPGGSFEAFSGTSMAAPHVAGAWAALRQATPNASVTTILNAFRQTGLPIKDNRFRGSVTVPRVRMFRALTSLIPVVSPAPSIVSVSPARLHAQSGQNTIIVNGSGFRSFSVVQWNGAARATTVLSTTQVRATLTAQDVNAVGSGQVSVSTPPPGGGSSISLTVPIDPPPSLTVSASLVGAETAVTVTLTNGFGGELDWLALASVGAANTSYLQWTYVGAGVFNTTWTVKMPTTSGTYEFRLFRDNGYGRVATSPSVTVDATLSAAPIASSLSPDRAIAGTSAFTLTIAGSKFTSSSIVRWNGDNRPTTFVSATQLQASIGAADVAAAGSAQVTVFTPAPGGGTSAALTFTINAPPVITVSATEVSPGGSVTATLTNGLGGTADWIALAPIGSPNTTYLQYTYIGANITQRTWTVSMPSTAGTYEFRLFPNNGYTRAATSPPVTVGTAGNPSPTVTGTTPSSVAAGSAAFALAVNGTGFVSGSVVRWNGSNRTTTYVSGTELRAAILAADVATAGTAQVTVFTPAPGGGQSAPKAFTIGTGGGGNTGTATLTVSASSVTAGQTVTATLSNGPGGPSDWLALAATGAPAGSYLTYVYVGSGVTTRTWSVQMPATPGTYEFRLFLNNGYVIGATSPPVTVTAGAPTLSVSTTTAAPGASVTVTLAGGYGGSTDWLALASTSASNTSYIQYIYVGAGVTSRTWTVTMPTAPGTYEFRLFLNNGYTRVATSPAVTVASQ